MVRRRRVATPSRALPASTYNTERVLRWRLQEAQNQRRWSVRSCGARGRGLQRAPKRSKVHGKPWKNNGKSMENGWTDAFFTCFSTCFPWSRPEKRPFTARYMLEHFQQYQDRRLQEAEQVSEEVEKKEEVLQELKADLQRVSVLALTHREAELKGCVPGRHFSKWHFHGISRWLSSIFMGFHGFS